MKSCFENARVFVSGGAGVIGCYLVEKLHQMGAKIFVGDLKPKPSDWPNDILYREGDLNDITKEELLNFKPTFYFHLAATFERSEESYGFLEENFHHNIKLSHYLLQCLKESRTLKKIVFASSYLVYDPRQYLFSSLREKAIILREDSLCYPRNLCGAAKFLHEQELAFLQKNYQNQLSVASARIYRSYGKNSRDIISRWIQSAVKNEPIPLFCKEGIFDYIYAGDVADGLLALAKTDYSGSVNLGRGRGRAVSDIIHILKTFFPLLQVQESPGSIPYEASQADMSLFRSLCGDSPQIDLEEGISLLVSR